MRELFVSYSAAFLFIFPMMILAVRNLIGGMLAMIPNLLPALFVFGGMSILHIEITLGVVITACLALGIAVDDTTHFLLRYRSHQQRHASHWLALNAAYLECSTAMFQTSLICSLGLLVLTASPVASLRQFATTIALFLAVALVCDLIILPAMLSSGLRRFLWTKEPIVRNMKE